MKTDFYKLLGISQDADEKMIRKAWRNKTKEVHPDVNSSPDANKQFRELSEALEILLNENLRLKHDRHFGYGEKIKNKYSNKKQHFSEYQQKKAKETVDEWSEDYNLAMEMREKQRKNHRIKHKRNLLFILVGIALLFITSLLLLFNFL
ncbi:hypothetical protein BH09BAC5_BH09BAC5_19910 [soil metagenome]